MGRHTAFQLRDDILRMSMSAGHAAAGGLHCVSILHKQSAPQPDFKMHKDSIRSSASKSAAGNQRHTSAQRAASLTDILSRSDLRLTAEDSVTPAGYSLLARLILSDALWSSPKGESPERSDIHPVRIPSLQSHRLSLDSLYGQEHGILPGLSDDSGIRFRIGLTEISGGVGHSSRHLPHDLSRNETGRANLADQGNDENLLFSQFLLIWMKLHNLIADRLAAHECPQPAIHARDLVVWHFHQIILRDFLPKIALAARKPEPESVGTRTLPTDSEWVMAMQCLWPGMQRQSYELNENFQEKPVDSAQLEALTGAGGIVPVPSNWIIDWRRFFSFRSISTGYEEAIHFNRCTKLDPMAAAAANPEFVSSAIKSSLSGIDNPDRICARFGLAPLSEQKIRAALPDALLAEISLCQNDARSNSEMPLWLYLMLEAALEQNGNRPGTLGATIIQNGIKALLRDDTESAELDLPDFPGRAEVLSLPLTDGIPARSLAELIAIIDATSPLISPLDDSRYGM